MATEHSESNHEKEMWMRRSEHLVMCALTALIFTLFIFWLGFELGEMRASIGSRYFSDYPMTQPGRGNVLYTTGTMRSVALPTPTTVTPVSVPAPTTTTKK